MLDNGDGAVRSGKAGFPSALIPANCSGTVTFERKESQTTLPVKPYQLVIDSCRVIEQSSGEMEMHLALIVDGYKFVETGFNFNQLPNSIAQLALPEWALESQPTTLVSLSSRRFDGYDVPLITLLFSDGSEKLLSIPDMETGSLVSSENGADIEVTFVEGCTYAPNLSYEMDGGNPPIETVEMSIAWDSCTMDDDVPKGRVILHSAEFDIIMDLTDNEDPSSYYFDKDDAVIVNN